MAPIRAVDGGALHGGHMEPRHPHLRRVGLIVLLALGTSGPALAQADLAGEWKSLPFEDLGFRVDAENVAEALGMTGVGGPWIGDYTGLPQTRPPGAERR